MKHYFKKIKTHYRDGLLLAKIKTFIITLPKRILFYYNPYINKYWLYNVFVSTYWTRFLKIKQNYSYINASSHGVGYTAWLDMLKKCNLNPMELKETCSKKDFLLLYKRESKNYEGKVFGITIDSAYEDLLRKNALKRFNKKVPIFVLVRDPINLLKSHTSEAYFDVLKDELANRGGQIDINYCKLKSINIAHLHHNKFFPKKVKTRRCFGFTSIPNQFLNACDNIYYINMKDIQSKEKSFQTFKMVCNILKVKEPENIDDFDIKYPRALGHGYPYQCYSEILNTNVIYNSSLQSKLNDVIEIASIEIQIPKYSISINIKEKDYKNIRGILENENLISKIKEKALSDNALLIKTREIYTNNPITEDDVLNYFSLNILERDYFSNLLDYEISGIQKHAPHILDEWVFYKKFIAICKENIKK